MDPCVKCGSKVYMLFWGFRETQEQGIAEKTRKKTFSSVVVKRAVSSLV
jgi:hypothetical protein